MAVFTGVPFDLTTCLDQAKARSGSLIETTRNFDGWTQLQNSGIPASMTIHERRGGALFLRFLFGRCTTSSLQLLTLYVLSRYSWVSNYR